MSLPAPGRVVLFALAALVALPSPAGAEVFPYVVVLGVAQDAGHPQAGCDKHCCAGAWKDPGRGHRVASLGIVDPASGQRWIIDATPDFPSQLRTLDELQRARKQGPPLSGVLLTHGHIGHYTGLVHLGREVMGARSVPVYAMPRMAALLGQHAPWELLVRLKNIVLKPLADGREIALNERIRVRPFAVPHRDEYTETVGFLLAGPRHEVLYLPDIDKWKRWQTPIEEVIAKVDRAYLDGTFFADGELPGRSMADIPHPFVVETIERLRHLPEAERAKVRFLHLNHTNPLLQPDSREEAAVRAAGMAVAREGEQSGL